MKIRAARGPDEESLPLRARSERGDTSTPSRPGRTRNNSESTYPVIEFTDRYERTHRFENKIGGSGFGIDGKIGQVVKVRYDPDDPTRAQWADQPGAWVTPAMLG
jgi:hypothetical protein